MGTLIFSGLFILSLISVSTIFEKAGKPGWAALIPLYNIIVFLEIIGKPWWWIFLLLIPFFNIIWIISASIRLVKSFGDKSVSAIGLICLPFLWLPLMAFDKNATYRKLPTDNIFF